MGEHEDAQRREHCCVLIHRFLAHHFPESDIETQGSRDITFVIDSGRYRLEVAWEFLGDDRGDHETERWLEGLMVVDRMRHAPNGVVFVEARPDGTPTVRVLRYEG